MKAFLLAAGRGSRLGDITKDTPKCLLKVGTKTMLEHWYFLFNMYNVTEVLINTHYLSEKVVQEYGHLSSFGIKTTFVHEKEILGTGKSVYLNKSFVEDERLFFIAYADTWMQPDLRGMVAFHKKRGGMGTLGLYKPKSQKDQGSIQVDGREILSIEEKPENPKGQYAFAGLMIGTHAMFRFYTEDMADLVRDWLPKIKDGLNPYFIDGEVLDIGTPERFKEANEKIRGMGLKAL